MIQLGVAFSTLLQNLLNTFGHVIIDFLLNVKSFLYLNKNSCNVFLLSVLLLLFNIHYLLNFLPILRGGLFFIILLNLHLLILSKDCFLLSLLASCKHSLIMPN